MRYLSPRLIPLIALLIAIVLGFVLGNMHLALLNGSADFRIYYAAAKVWLSGGNPYQIHQLQQIDPTVSTLGYVYPPWALFIIAPLTMLSLSQAAGVWLMLNIEMFLAAILLLGRYFHLEMRWLLWLIIIGLLGFPGLFVLIQGQISFFLLLLLICAYLCLQRQKLAWAGFFLAFSLLKPQLVWLPVIVLFLCAFRQNLHKRLMIWFSMALGLLLAVSWLSFPSWLLSWLGAIQRDSAIGDPTEQHVTDNMGTIFALAHHLPFVPLSILLIVVTWLAAAFLLIRRFCQKGDDRELFALSCALVGVLSPWMWIYDGVIWLIPVAALALRSSRRASLALALYGLLPYGIRLFYFFFLSHLEGTSFNKVEDVLVPLGLTLLLAYPYRIKSRTSVLTS